MTVAKQMDIRDNIKKYFDIAFNGEAILVPRKENKNVYIISQQEYEELQKAKRNAEYLKMIDHSINQLNDGNTVKMTMEDLRGQE